jgi:hypothetical protein
LVEELLKNSLLLQNLGQIVARLGCYFGFIEQLGHFNT